MDKNKLILRNIHDSDINLVSQWLQKDYVLKWYNDADEWLNEIKERNATFSFLHHFIVSADDKPIGFCQYYDCFDAKEEWYEVDESGKIYSIDYLIGEEQYLRKGYAKEIIKRLTEKIKSNNKPEKIIVQPENENIASCKALLSSGFVYEEEKKYYLLMLNK